MTTLGLGFGSALGPLGSPVTQNITFLSTLFAELVETIGASTTLVGTRQTPGALSDSFGVFILDEKISRARQASLTEGVVISVAETLLRGVVMAERLRASADLEVVGIRQVTLEDIARLVDRQVWGRGAELTDSVAVSSALQAQVAVAVIEALGLTSTLAVQGIFNRSLTESVLVLDELLRFFGADVTDSVTLDSALSVTRKTYQSESDGVSISDALSPQLLIRATLTEGVDITAEMAVRMLFTQEVIEGIELVVGYLSPGEGFTTWVANTKTAAVSEYTNFAFNSFARFDNKYVGANSDGLFELLGDTDAGTDIISVLKGGYLQFGGTHLSRLSAAYIAAHGDEDQFYLKIETKDGESYTYRVDTRDGRSTKFHMGKGQRARYFSWELTSVGQDFTIDTLEFVPIVVKRRV